MTPEEKAEKKKKNIEEMDKIIQAKKERQEKAREKSDRFNKPFDEISFIPYWMIHKSEYGTKRDKSMMVYFEEHKAIEECLRLCKTNPNARFYLMKTIQVFTGVAKDVEIKGKVIE